MEGNNKADALRWKLTWNGTNRAEGVQRNFFSNPDNSISLGHL
jgi:hypothetical protein